MCVPPCNMRAWDLTYLESKLLDILLAPLRRLETYEGSLVLDQFEINTQD